MRISILAAALFLTTFGASAQDSTRRNRPFGQVGRILETILTPTATGGALTSTDIAQGLKEALTVGITNGSSQASAIDGYFGNPLIRLAFPPEAQRVATRLRQLGFGRQVDQFELSLNRAAEGAARKALPVFGAAIRQMTIQDAVGILRGQNDAATQYLRRTSGQELARQFSPIVDSTLRQYQATRHYATLVNTYNRLPMVQRVNPNLTEYATQKAVDGLFLLVAQEEAKIRQDPAARVSAILRRVFGAR